MVSFHTSLLYQTGIQKDRMYCMPTLYIQIKKKDYTQCTIDINNNECVNREWVIFVYVL